ncbi:hypothetical protein [Arthrobacter rhombi]|uniref:hypothetical protein n=1 Tax=Arthrobacter rhombi TaxID=71253 RepID=UPI003FD686BC
MWNLVADMRKHAVLNNRIIPVYSKSERDGLSSAAPGGVVPEGTVVLRMDQVAKGAVFDVFADGKWQVGETGILTSGISIIGSGVAEVNSYSVTRSGPTVTARVDLTYQGPKLTTDSVGNIPDTDLFTIETAWKPVWATSDVNLMRPGIVQWFAYVSEAGTCAATHGMPGMVLDTGHKLRMDGSWRIA